MEEAVRGSPCDVGLEPGSQEPQDLFEYLERAHPVNALISRYGPQIVELLEADRRFLRLENRLGWAKWVQRESFLRRMRVGRFASISITRFLENYGDEAFRAVRQDTRRFEVDLEHDMIHTIPIDPVREARAIIGDHYRSEFEAGRVLGLEVELGTSSKEAVIARLFVEDRVVGRVIGKGGVRVKGLTSRILNEIGVNARIVILNQWYMERKPHF
jgi:predicted RNA-binding protein YlqC (UPF0109 family)